MPSVKANAVRSFMGLVSWLFEGRRCAERIGKQKIGVLSCSRRYSTHDYRYSIAQSDWGFPVLAAAAHWRCAPPFRRMRRREVAEEGSDPVRRGEATD
jgi:hypothetical protein